MILVPVFVVTDRALHILVAPAPPPHNSKCGPAWASVIQCFLEVYMRFHFVRLSSVI
jgi:hypothetical protein